MGNKPGVFRRTAWIAAGVTATASATAWPPSIAALLLVAYLVAAGFATNWIVTNAFVYYVGLLTLMTVALVTDPWVVFGIWIVFLHAFALFSSRWAFAWSAIGAVVLTLAQTGLTAEVAPILISLMPPLVVAGFYLVRESTALQNALAANRALQRRLVEQTRDAERQRVAQDLHDTLAQDLSAAVALLEAEGDRDERVRRARELVRSGLAEARRSVQALTPAPLDGVPLADALDGLVKQWAADTGIDATFAGDVTPPMRRPVAAAVYRIGQSALANVAEHAQATRVRLTLSCLDDRVVLDVRDDGVGFDPNETPGRGRGFGLPGMRERAGALGGTVEVETERGAGTAVRAAIPVSA